MPWEIGTPYPSSLAPKTLAGLPNPAGLRTGASFAVTDYGGNIATVVAGAWRFEYPFRTTWAGRPAVGLVPAGTELQVTDYANQKWINDGASWRPAQGRALVKNIFGTIATPLAVITGVTAGAFSLPGGNIRIPAGMIAPNSRVIVSHTARRTTSAATANLVCYLGTAGNQADTGIVSQNLAATANLDIVACSGARFGTSKTTMVCSNYLSEYTTTTGAGVATDRTFNVNTDADMFVSFGVISANIADSFGLVSYSVSLEA